MPAGSGQGREALGVSLVRSSEHDLPARATLFGAAEVHVGRREQTEAGVVVRIVVPAEGIAVEPASVFNAAEALRKIRPIGYMGILPA